MTAPYEVRSARRATDPPTAPTVAVVVPAYRVERYIQQTLRSVQAQTVTDWECIVVDDGSPDDTAARVVELMTADPRIRLVRQENRRLSGARNTGIAHISDSVRLVAFLDSDDTWCPDALERLAAALADDPEAVGAYGYAEWMDEDGAPLEPGLQPARQRDRRRVRGRWTLPVAPSEPVRFEELVVNNPMWPPAVALHRREVVDAVGPFDTDLHQVEDVDYFTRMARHGHFRPVERQVAWYRQHTGQMTRGRAEFWWFHDMVRHKTWASRSNSPAQRRVAARAWRVAQWRRIARCGARLLSAFAHGDRASVRRFVKGLAVLLAQAARPGPPAARIEHVVWTGRDV